MKYAYCVHEHCSNCPVASYLPQTSAFQQSSHMENEILLVPPHLLVSPIHSRVKWVADLPHISRSHALDYYSLFKSLYSISLKLIPMRLSRVPKSRSAYLPKRYLPFDPPLFRHSRRTKYRQHTWSKQRFSRHPHDGNTNTRRDRFFSSSPP